MEEEWNPVEGADSLKPLLKFYILMIGNGAKEMSLKLSDTQTLMLAVECLMRTNQKNDQISDALVKMGEGLKSV